MRARAKGRETWGGQSPPIPGSPHQPPISAEGVSPGDGECTGVRGTPALPWVPKKLLVTGRQRGQAGAWAPRAGTRRRAGGDTSQRGSGGFWVVGAGGIYWGESQRRQQLPGAGELFWEPAHWIAIGKWVTATKPNSPSSHERRIPPSLPQGDLWPLSRNTSRCQK